MGFTKLIKCISCFILLIFIQQQSKAQSLEITVGNQNVFANVQWFKFIDTTGHWSIFTRGIANINYEGNTDLFLGGYFNYTSKIGLGATIVSRIGTFDSGGDIGGHFLKNGKDWSIAIFATVGIGLAQQLQYTIFSNLQYRPKISKKVNLYTNLELYSQFNNWGHVYSIQRFRVGLSWKSWQIGAAADFIEIDNAFLLNYNIGGFLRKEF